MPRKTFWTFLAPALFALAILAGGGALTGALLAGRSALFPLPPSAEAHRPAGFARSLLRGDLARRIDGTIEKSHPLRDPALHLVTALRVALFREGSGPVVIGRDFRLYTEEEFRRSPEDEMHLEMRLEWIRSILQRLAREQVEVVVLLLPSKARVLGEPAADHPRYERALASLSREGALLVDPREVLAGEDDYFLAFDTHWSPRGALAVAREIARRAGEIPALRDIPRIRVTLEEEGLHRHEGDLLQFLPLGRWKQFFPLGPEEVPRFSFHFREVRGGLFDLPEIPLALAGTSFSAGPFWDFPGALSYAFQADLIQVASPGEGPFLPMARYLASESYREIPPCLILWEIPERYLTLPGFDPPSQAGET